MTERPPSIRGDKFHAFSIFGPSAHVDSAEIPSAQLPSTETVYVS